MPDLEYCECGAMKGLCEMGVAHKYRLRIKELEARLDEKCYYCKQNSPLQGECVVVCVPCLKDAIGGHR